MHFRVTFALVLRKRGISLFIFNAFPRQSSINWIRRWVQFFSILTLELDRLSETIGINML